jgi:hypothetical protein
MVYARGRLMERAVRMTPADIRSIISSPIMMLIRIICSTGAITVFQGTPITKDQGVAVLPTMNGTL